ncbi:uncharacterized protein LOC27209054 isoform X4 [Drosophila simulans]|uniref:Uncharacterized protein, isoform C n=1 Tax=Drosophila simulans TaxID=7240 RepID=A0A0J9RXH7_DROSI|nr:uncharacterized protein LOC27209054 isoform X4 [Drosophila simulans]KMZ00362.1 uncharacterized protein Dsimw501_GD29211, isoform C [Drosophila simulans]
MHFFRIENKHVWDGENQRNHKARQVKCVSRNIINFPFCRQQPRKAARQEVQRTHKLTANLKIHI